MENMNKKFKSKVIETLILASFALILCFAVWQVFLTDNENVSFTTDEEAKLVTLLESIEGVGEAEVMISTNENGARGAVVVCDGANDFQVIMNVRQAVAAAVGTSEKSVKIYQKKD